MNDTPDSNMPEDDEIDLKALSDDELVEQMHDDLYDGLSTFSLIISYHLICILL